MSLESYKYVGSGTVQLSFPTTGTVTVAYGDVVELDSDDVGDRPDFEKTKEDLKPFTETYPEGDAVGALDAQPSVADVPEAAAPTFEALVKGAPVDPAGQE